MYFFCSIRYFTAFKCDIYTSHTPIIEINRYIILFFLFVSFFFFSENINELRQNTESSFISQQREGCTMIRLMTCIMAVSRGFICITVAEVKQLNTRQRCQQTSLFCAVMSGTSVRIYGFISSVLFFFSEPFPCIN